LGLWRRRIWRYRLTTAGAILTVFGAATVFTYLPLAENVLAAAIGVVLLIIELVGNRRSARGVRFEERINDDYADVLQRDSGYGRPLKVGASVGLILVAESHELRARDIPATIHPDDFTIQPDLGEFQLEFLARRARNATVFDRPNVGLVSDMPADASGREVVLRRGRYFDFIGTNLLAARDVYEAGRRAPMLRGRDLFVNRHGRLRRFDESRLFNIVGVSTLAFTTDGKLLLVRQTERNIGSPGLLAPSGSGALEGRDLPASNTDTLQQIVIRGAVRELCEEAAIERHEVGDSVVIGHGRWLTRGAMPEFCAITMLEVASAATEVRRPRRSERTYIDGTVAVRLADPPWNPQQPLSILPDVNVAAASWPLAFGLSCLADAMADAAWPLRSRLLDRLNG
jgi:hypothetical protein